MKMKYKKYTKLYMYYLRVQHTNHLAEIFNFRNALCMGHWNRLKYLHKKVMEM